MKIVIITGMSGAGKSSAINLFEDMGYYCMDNMPPELLASVADFIVKSDSVIDKICVAVDVRSGELYKKLEECTQDLKRSGIDVSILFVDCDDDCLLRRFKETRRKHPLDEEASGNLVSAIALERVATSRAREIADYYIDSSSTGVVAFKDKIKEMFFEKSDAIIIDAVSFGFKHGVPKDADLVFDVRCLPNPFYVPELKPKTGLDDEVYNYVMSFDDAKAFYDKIYDMVKFLIPLYAKEGKSRLVIAFGCTGGKHRSISFARRLSNELAGEGFTVRADHRHIDY
ncbi:MAG: RNase adapter RapZ [Oscillospiraceae bacterium]|nr:RNase adapter RapZ [Oscillospiraceae bacterium]